MMFYLSGYWWRRDLFASCAVEENIQKARKAFFHFGSIGAFQDDLSPLSTRSVVETCGSSASIRLGELDCDRGDTTAVAQCS